MLDNNMVIVVLAYCWHIDYLTIFNIAALSCCCSTITSLPLYNVLTINDHSHTYKNGLMHTWKKWGMFVNNNILISPAICWPWAGSPLINNSLSSGNTSLCYVMQLAYVQTLLIKKHNCYDSKYNRFEALFKVLKCSNCIICRSYFKGTDFISRSMCYSNSSFIWYETRSLFEQGVLQP